MAGTTPSQGIPYAERPDPFELTSDLRGSFNKIDSVFAQTRGESSAALSSATSAELKAGQALARALAIEEPVHVGPTAPTDGEALWVDTDEDPAPTPVVVDWETVTDKPTSFPSTIPDVDGLADALAAAGEGDWADAIAAMNAAAA